MILDRNLERERVQRKREKGRKRKRERERKKKKSLKKYFISLYTFSIEK